ncbi:polysaccharide pyruvyl transferase family protein, partial [Escherichia coli]|nr:polysaccharide pyruvyl transferase family protein [Escherichia coli]
MKVAILTQPLHTNYGGTLQAYALQKVLINLGHEPETINYRSKIKRPLFIRVVLSKIKRIVLCRKITFDFTTQDRINIRKHHQSFIDTRLNYSEEINGTEGLRDYILKNNYG